MTQALSESFCERCGTRYQLESHRAKSGALAGVRVLGKGLRKLALTRASSLDEALETARHDDERAANSRALEAFHGAFHFCLSCRQYTCVTCWNPAAGVCLTCVPTADSNTPEGLDGLRTAMAPEEARLEQAAAQNGAAHAEAWPGGPTSGPTATGRPNQARDQPATPRQVDEWGRPIAGGVTAAPSAPEAATARNPLDADAASVGLTGTVAWPTEPPTNIATEPKNDARAAEFDDDAPIASHMAPWAKAADRPIVVEPAVAAPTAVEPVAAGPLTPTATAPGAQVPGSTSEWLHPGTSLDAAIAAYEAALRTDAQLATMPVLAPLMVEPQPGPEVAVAQLEPDVAVPQPEPEFAMPLPHPSTADLLPFVTLPSPRPQPVVEPRRAAAHLETDAIPRRSEGSGLAEDPRFAAWSIRAPEAPRPMTGPTPADAVRSAAKAVGVPAPGSSPVATAPRVAAAAGGQACVNCGLSLSATARFCRRCGTRQG